MFVKVSCWHRYLLWRGNGGSDREEDEGTAATLLAQFGGAGCNASCRSAGDGVGEHKVVGRQQPALSRPSRWGGDPIDKHCVEQLLLREVPIWRQNPRWPVPCFRNVCGWWGLNADLVWSKLSAQAASSCAQGGVKYPTYSEKIPLNPSTFYASFL